MRSTKHRFEIWNNSQHPFKHTLGDFSYFHTAIPGVSNLEGALNWILAVLYPNALEPVATPADLPAVGNAINDYRVVYDDGDGKSAAYRWEQREGELAASWHKIYDMDWGSDSILTDYLNQTQELYAVRQGHMDRDISGNIVGGIYAGQRIFGGTQANSNLTLSANSGDGIGASTGFVQFSDAIRSTVAGLDIGTLANAFRSIYLTDKVYADTLTIEGGMISDSTGELSFDGNNLSTIGTISALSATFEADTSIEKGKIKSLTGEISFETNKLKNISELITSKVIVGNTTLTEAILTSSSGSLAFGGNAFTSVGKITCTEIETDLINIDDIRLDNSTISIITADTDLTLLANGTGKILIGSDVQILLKNLTLTGGNLSVVGDITGNKLIVDNLNVNGNTLSSTAGNIVLSSFTAIVTTDSDFIPTASKDIGASASLWKDFYFSGKFSDGTNNFTGTDFFKLRNLNYRDAARTLPAQTGDTLLYDAVSGTWLAGGISSSVDHASIDGLTDGDAGHTQFVMLAGRSGGQTVYGGIIADENLVLKGNITGNGNIIFGNSLITENAPSWGAGIWTGLDLGDSTKKFRHLYTVGEFFGFRFENVTVLPSASSSATGRAVWHKTEKKLYVDDGGVSFKPVGVNKYDAEHTFDGTQQVYDIDVSAKISDATGAIRQLAQKNGSQYQNVFCDIIALSATTVRISATPALPAGVYRLTLLE